MIKGTIYAVTDINIALQAAMQGTKILYIGELNKSLPQEFIECSVLLPPYEAVFAEVDGDMASFEAVYNNYLTYSEQCFGMFATILVAISKGVNIIMYIENGDELSHFNFLLRYFEGTYGLSIGTKDRSFYFNPEFNWLIASILYSYMDGFISEEEFIISQDNHLNLLVLLDQNHPFIKPVGKLINKFGINTTNILEWLVNYQRMVCLYGSVIPGSAVQIERDE